MSGHEPVERVPVFAPRPHVRIWRFVGIRLQHVGDVHGERVADFSSGDLPGAGSARRRRMPKNARGRPGRPGVLLLRGMRLCGGYLLLQHGPHGGASDLVVLSRRRLSISSTASRAAVRDERPTVRLLAVRGLRFVQCRGLGEGSGRVPSVIGRGGDHRPCVCASRLDRTVSATRHACPLLHCRRVHRPRRAASDARPSCDFRTPSHLTVAARCGVSVPVVSTKPSEPRP